MTKRNGKWASMFVGAALALQLACAPAAQAMYRDKSDELPGFADEGDVWLFAGLGAAAVTAIILAVVLIPGDDDDAAGADAPALADAADSEVNLFVDVKPVDGDAASLDASDLALQLGLSGAF